MRRRLQLATADTFRSLRERNFRLFFIGQGVSQIGTWVQSVALVWLVLSRTGSGVALGVTTALQFLPLLVLGPWAGLVADRVDKRKLLVATQAAAAAQAGGMGLLVLTGSDSLPLIYALSLVFGIITAVDNPVRRAFVVELVAEQHVPNAIGLNSALMTGSRIVGPAVAGVLIAGVGVAWCFLVNALSYVAVLAGLARMDAAGFGPAARAERARGQLREGFRYVWRTPELRLPLLLVGVAATLAFNYPVLLPLLAERSLGGGASTFGLLYSTMSVGSLAGALVIARRTHVDGPWLARGALAYGAALVVLASAPTLPLAVAATVPVGITGVMLLSGANTALQLHAAPAMRGRVNALFAMFFLGSTPLGGPAAGWVAEHFGARAGLALGAVATMLAGAAALAVLRRRATTAEVPAPEVLAAEAAA